MQETNFYQSLLSLPDLVVDDVELSPKRITLRCHVSTPQQACPHCLRPSAASEAVLLPRLRSPLNRAAGLRRAGQEPHPPPGKRGRPAMDIRLLRQAALHRGWRAARCERQDRRAHLLPTGTGPPGLARPLRLRAADRH